MEMPEADLPVPAYALGAWLGDGHADSARFTTFDPEIVMNVEASGWQWFRKTQRGVWHSFPVRAVHQPDGYASFVEVVPAKNSRSGRVDAYVAQGQVLL
jgi:replicative DNA helicase